MVLCPRCGNKRCPHASDHRHVCTNSNEPGQPGSEYANVPVWCNHCQVSHPVGIHRGDTPPIRHTVAGVVCVTIPADTYERLLRESASTPGPVPCPKCGQPVKASDHGICARCGWPGKPAPGPKASAEETCVCGHALSWHVGPTGVGLGAGPACHCGCDRFVVKAAPMPGKALLDAVDEVLAAAQRDVPTSARLGNALSALGALHDQALAAGPSSGADQGRAISMMRKLDTMPATNVDLKDAVRQKLGRRIHPLPFAKGSDTSEAAADSMVGHAERIRESVFEFVRMCGTAGTTCDNAEAYLGLSHQTCSARFNELRNANRIIDTGHREKTRSGRMAAVYIVARPA